MRVPLLPKLRGHFAEFLDHSSPERLGILYQTTCVGLGYGPTRPSLEAFLDSIGTPASPLRAPHHTSAFVCRGFAYDTAYMLGPGQPPPGIRLPSCVTPSLAYYPPRSPALAKLARRRPLVRAGLVSRDSALAVRVGYGNINPLSIDYACRPRLRPRLTLGGTAWPRNPWSIGARSPTQPDTWPPRSRGDRLTPG